MNARLPLEPADIVDNFSHFCIPYSADRRHVAKSPVVGLHPHLGGTIEGRIRMATGFIDLMDKRRSLSRSSCKRPVAAKTPVFKELLSFRILSRH